MKITSEEEDLVRTIDGICQHYHVVMEPDLKLQKSAFEIISLIRKHVKEEIKKVKTKSP